MIIMPDWFLEGVVDHRYTGRKTMIEAKQEKFKRSEWSHHVWMPALGQNHGGIWGIQPDFATANYAFNELSSVVINIFSVNIIIRYSFSYNEAKTMRFFSHSRFYLDIKKGQEVDRICGSKTGLSVLSDSSSVLLRYHADRDTRRASGFQAQYYMLNGSLTKGQSSKFLISYLES